MMVESGSLGQVRVGANVAVPTATGEEVPTGQSIRARMLILEVAPVDVNVGVLSECQRSAAAGLFSETMGTFLRWVAARYEQVEERRRKRVVELRSALGHAAHSRTPGMIAELQTGFEIFLEFAAEIGAITPPSRVTRQTRHFDGNSIDSSVTEMPQKSERSRLTEDALATSTARPQRWVKRASAAFN